MVVVSDSFLSSTLSLIKPNSQSKVHHSEWPIEGEKDMSHGPTSNYQKSTCWGSRNSAAHVEGTRGLHIGGLAPHSCMLADQICPLRLWLSAWRYCFFMCSLFWISPTTVVSFTNILLCLWCGLCSHRCRETREEGSAHNRAATHQCWVSGLESNGSVRKSLIHGMYADRTPRPSSLVTILLAWFFWMQSS